MRHRKRIFKIGRRPDHVRSLLANQVCSLIIEGRIYTTLAKAKEVKRFAEKMVTLGKQESLHHRRRAISKLHQVDAVRKLFDEIAPKYTEREGGYTRIIKLRQRRGDAAPMCYLEFVEQELKKNQIKKSKSGKGKPVATKENNVEVTDETGESPAGTQKQDARKSSKSDQVDAEKFIDAENENSPRGSDTTSKSDKVKLSSEKKAVDSFVKVSKETEQNKTETESLKDSDTEHPESDSAEEKSQKADDRKKD